MKICQLAKLLRILLYAFIIEIAAVPQYILLCVLAPFFFSKEKKNLQIRYIITYQFKFFMRKEKLYITNVDKNL